MQKFKNKIAFIIATKERPKELRRLLKSLEIQSYRPDQVIIVESGENRTEEIKAEFPGLEIKYLRCHPPSITKQRNMGIKKADPGMTLIGFLDDDVVLKNNALMEMMVYWENAPENIGLASFNITNLPSIFASRFKSLAVTEKLGLYSKKKGIVLPSGFQTIYGFVSNIVTVQYLPTPALVGRRDIFKKHMFDEWFSGYSYLEDLDFSYRVSKEYTLVIVQNAKYSHYPTSVGKESAFTFGIKEVINRIYFVKKNQGFSLFKCYLALTIRLSLNLYIALSEQKISYFYRASGNLVGFVKEMLRKT